MKHGDSIDTRLPSSQMEAFQKCLNKKVLMDRFYEVCAILLWSNEPLAQELHHWSNGEEIHEDRLNPSQKTLATIALLEMEVANGGLLQFLWNHPSLIKETPKTFHRLDLKPLEEAYSQAITKFDANFKTFVQHKKQDSLEAYSECASELDFDEFESVFFAQQDQLYTIALEFVTQNLHHFVQVAGPNAP